MGRTNERLDFFRFRISILNSYTIHQFSTRLDSNGKTKQERFVVRHPQKYLAHVTHSHDLIFPCCILAGLGQRMPYDHASWRIRRCDSGGDQASALASDLDI